MHAGAYGRGVVRHLRIDVPGGIAHLTARENNRTVVFPSAEHRDRLVDLLEHGDWSLWLECHAYVAMHNHYHLLVENPLPNLSLGMQ